MRKGGRPRKFAAAKTLYRLNNPIIPLGVGELERLLNHCIQLTSLPAMSETERECLMARHRYLMKEGRERVKQAKQFYNLQIE